MAGFARFDGAATWKSLTVHHQQAIGAIALEIVAAWYCQENDPDQVNRHEETPLTRAASAADALLLMRLQEAFVEAVPRSALEHQGKPRLPSLLGAVCRACGCSQNDACQPFSCSWVEPDLCSACKPAGGAP